VSVKPDRLYPTRRSVIAGLTGLAAAGFGGNSARAQADEDSLPDAFGLLTTIMPQLAPRLRFTDPAGNPLSLGGFTGHPLLVNLWATWCGPCVDEMPALSALAQKMLDFGGLVLPISIDMSGAAAVRPFYAAHGIRTLPILLDPDGDDMQVLGTNGVPFSLVINAAGQMVAHLDRAANWDTPAVLQYLRGLGAKPPASNAVRFIPV
jgi:thiol-disulfide isomerase/thioredoxin